MTKFIIITILSCAALSVHITTIHFQKIFFNMNFGFLFPLCFKHYLFYLKGRVTARKEDSCFKDQFTPRMTTVARAGPVGSREPGAASGSPTWMWPRCIRGLEVAATTRTGILLDVGTADSSFTCCATALGPDPFLFFSSFNSISFLYHLQTEKVSIY